MNDTAIRSLAALFAESNRLDEEWIATTVMRTGMAELVVREAHGAMIELAQSSRFTIRQVEGFVDERLTNGLSLDLALRMTRITVRLARAIRSGKRIERGV